MWNIDNADDARGFLTEVKDRLPEGMTIETMNDFQVRTLARVMAQNILIKREAIDFLEKPSGSDDQ